MRGAGFAAWAYVQWVAKRGGTPALVDALARPKLRPHAAFELGQLRAQEAVPALLACLEGPEDDAGRREVVGALGLIGDVRASPALSRLLASQDLDLQASAHSGLVAIGGVHVPKDPFARHEREIMESVERVARNAIDSSAATLTTKPADGPAPAIFELQPENRGACPVKVQADSVQQISLFIGPHSTWWETWLDDRAALRGWVEETVRGIIDGRYEEWVWPGEFRQAKGVLHLPRGDRAIYNNMIRSSPGIDWEHLAYEPYVA